MVEPLSFRIVSTYNSYDRRWVATSQPVTPTSKIKNMTVATAAPRPMFGLATGCSPAIAVR